MVKLEKSIGLKAQLNSTDGAVSGLKNISKPSALKGQLKTKSLNRKNIGIIKPRNLYQKKVLLV